MALPTISYTDIMRIPFPVRQSLRNTPLADIMSSALTPGQTAALFPSYINQVFTSSGPAQKTAAQAYGTGSYPNASGQYTGAPPSGGGRTRTTTTGATGPDPSTGDPRVDRLLKMIARAEGTSVSYDTQFDYQNINREAAGGKPLTQMTIAEVRDLMSKTPANKRAMGRYQFIPDTFDQVVAEMGLKGDELFSPEMQDKMIVHRMAATRGLNSWLSGKLSDDDFMHNLAQEFASLPSPKNKGKALYGGVGLNGSTPQISMDDVRSELGEIKKLPSEYQPSVAESNTVKLNGQTASLLPANYVNLPEVDQEHLTSGVTRSLPLDAELEKKIAWAIDNISSDSIENGRRFEWKSTSGGHNYETGIAGTVGGHWEGKGSDGYLVEIMPDGSRRTVSLSSKDDEEIRANFATYLGYAGIKEFGASYEGMGDNQMHIAISGDDGVIYDNDMPPEMKKAYEDGLNIRNTSEAAGRKYSEVVDEQIDSWAKARQEEVLAQRAAEEEQKAASAESVPTATETASSLQYEYNDAGKPINPDTGFLMDTSDPRYAAATAASQSTPTANTEPQITASNDVVPLGGYSAAAGGAQINDPSYIVSEDGKKLTKVAETGPEKIEMNVTPRNRADQFGLQPQITEPPQSGGKGDDMKQTMTAPVSSGFGQQFNRASSGEAVIDANHQKLGVTSRIAYAQSKFQSPFNTPGISGDTGMIYVTRGVG